MVLRTVEGRGQLRCAPSTPQRSEPANFFPVFIFSFLSSSFLSYQRFPVVPDSLPTLSFNLFLKSYYKKF